MLKKCGVIEKHVRTLPYQVITHYFSGSKEKEQHGQNTVPYTKLGVGVAKAKGKTSSLMRAIVWKFMNVYKYKFHKIIRR